MATALRIVFWSCSGLIVYAFCGYPLLLWVLGLLCGREVRKTGIEPSVSLLIAAYNEAAVIAEKVRNALAADYPADRLEIVVASDGSTDDTAEIVRRVVADSGSDRVRLLDYPQNRGKLAVLNDTVPKLRGEIVVFSDASSILGRDSLRRLVANFADPNVGAASGVYKVLRQDAANLGAQEDLYWLYETFLKTLEASLGVLTGAHGSLYGMRKELYPFPPPGTINDDFVIPTSVTRRGYRIAYEPGAVAYEEAEEMEGFGRRIRITAGNVRQLAEMKGFLWPLRPGLLFSFVSHKLLRVVVPVAMALALISNALLWRSPFYLGLLLAQLAFYSLAIAGALYRLRPRVLRLPYYFCRINSSLFVWAYYALFQHSASDARRPGIRWA